MFAGEIAEELDVSPQLVGTRGKRLAEQELITRRSVKNKRQLEVTDRAKDIYFSEPDASSLQVDEESAEW